MQAVPTRKARRRRNQKRKIKIRAGKPKKDKKDDKEKDNNKKVRKTQTAKLKSDTGSPNGHSKAEDKHLVAAMAKAKVTDVAGEPFGKLGPIPGVMDVPRLSLQQAAWQTRFRSARWPKIETSKTFKSPMQINASWRQEAF